MSNIAQAPDLLLATRLRAISADLDSRGLSIPIDALIRRLAAGAGQ